jgi:mRNA interferase MazF
VIGQGDIWWLERPDSKRRPCLVLTRNGSIPVLAEVLVAPISTRERGLPSEVRLDARDGVSRPSVLNMQHVMAVPKALLTRRIGQLAPGRWHEVCEAMRIAIGC